RRKKEKVVVVKPVLLFNCPQASCGATFNRQRKLLEHETVHTGAVRPAAAASRGKPTCSSYHFVFLRRCEFSGCNESFFDSSKLKRHVGYVHGDMDKFFKCDQPNCSMTFRKRRLLKLHVLQHGETPKFKCLIYGCVATFDSHVARKAHAKKHAGYRCPRENCRALEATWGKLQQHIAKHPVTFECQVCKKPFKKRKALRRHKRIHAIHKPVLVCPREECQAYFSTTFNLQHHIRKVHLQLLKYKCSFPDCPRTFAMRESLMRHFLRHDPGATMKKHHRPKKAWLKRLNGHGLPILEDDLRRLFALRMRVSRRAKVEANLAGLFNERKIPHYVDPEVNLRSLFSIKQPRPEVAPAATA
uniref:Si:dkey-208k4.2 n=1 Tax=Salarias fasciatus TaxID=181472 RepID=A0A672F1P1_SALFA